MKDIYQEHTEITSEVKQFIENHKIVFPSTYGKLYAEAAQKRDVKLKPEEVLSREMLDEKLVRHIITLSDCTNRAIEAMETQNKTALQTIIAETKKLRHEIRELQKIIYKDTLTKCYNRKWFEDMVLESDKHSLRGDGTVVMVDLNRFKEINDTFGHITGDKVLMHIAVKLKQTGGYVVRYGGDEFMVLFDAKHVLGDIKQKMETVLQYFDKTHYQVDGKTFKISFAYGMASYTQGADILNVVEMADKAMYRHKNDK